ncbi:MAG: NUDIX hydrolase [Candidatus Moraniibacteriota bacterium]
MYYLEKPEVFDPKFEIVACWLERDGKFVLLHRQPWKSEGNTWGVPAGKMHDGESMESAMVREIFEETGLAALEKDLVYQTTLFVRYETYDFVYHMFRMDAPDGLEVMTNPEEHQDHRWVTPEDALRLPLIPELDSCVKMTFGQKSP